MSIRQILADPETVSDLELASGERLREAQELVARGMGAASVYLAGYAAERMHENWSVAMRYRKLSVRPEDSKAMIEDVGWLRKRAPEFWR